MQLEQINEIRFYCFWRYSFFSLLFYALVSYFAGDKAILSMSNAQPLDEKKFPFVYNVVEGLSIAAGIPMPKLYIIEDPSPNAFAIGREIGRASCRERV